MAGWYRQGTVALTPGSAAVAGAGTMWMGVVRPGSAFTTDGRTLYEIREIANDRTLTLDRPWEGETAAASAYAVIAASATLSNAELAGEIAAMVAKWAVREDQYDDWLGGFPNGGPNADGKYPLTDSKGVTRLVESPARLLQLLDDGVVEHAAQIIAAIEDDVATARQAATAATAAMTAVGADRQAVAQAAATVAAQTGESTAAAATATAQAAIAVHHADEAANSAAAAAGLEASATAALAAVETARDIVLEARTEAGTAATGALSARTAAEAARDTATAARDAAQQARDASLTARTQAQDWAVKTDAPVSGSLKSALSYALDAASQATVATGKAMEASGSAAAAAASAADLDTAATAAQAAAGDAATGAQTATVKAAAAALSADTARSAAQQAETAGSGSATARAAAEAARDSTAISMTAAQVAASQAGQSQTNAANSAQTAATAAADAISAKSDATAARDLTVAARTEAQGARDLAQAFAQGAVGYQPSPGVYSAFHWSEQAKGHAQTAATIVGGSNFGIVGDGTSQRFAAENPGSLLNLVQAPGGKLTFNPGNRAVSFGFDATTAPVAASGNITAGTVQGALEEIDHRLSTLSQDSIANGGGSVRVTEDGAVEIVPAAGRTATYKGGELHTSATAYDKAQTDAAIAAMIAAGQAAGAARLTTPRTIALSGGATGTATSFDGTQNIAIPVTAVAASALTGTIDIARLPAGALERLYPVASDAERFALTTAQVQKGDTVQVGGTGGLMYLVVDESNLGNAAGYRAYTAARASAVDWSGVENKPALLTALASLDAGSGVLVQTGASTAAKRAVGVANATDIPDRAAADGRYAQLAGANGFTGKQTIIASGAALPASTNMAAATSNTGGLEVQPQGTGGMAGAAFMSFHRPNSFAVHVGLDTDNKFKIGGWSMGGVAHEFWHAGNITFDTAASANSAVKRDGNGNLFGYGLLGAYLSLSSPSPQVTLNESDAGTDGKLWSRSINNGVMTEYITNDANTANTPWLAVARSGMTITGIDYKVTPSVNGTALLKSTDADANATASKIAMRDSGGGVGASAFNMVGTAPAVNAYNSAAAVDNRRWQSVVSGNTLYQRVNSDDWSSYADYLTVTRSGISVTSIDFKAHPTVNGAPLATNTNTVAKSAVTVLPATGTLDVPAKTILGVYSQFVGQAFNVDYNTEAQYTQENAATGTDQVGGAFQLYNTAGAQIDSATKLLIHADGTNGSTEIIDERGITPFGTHCGWFDGASHWTVPSNSKLAWGASQNFTYEGWIRPNGVKASCFFSSNTIGLVWQTTGQFQFYNSGWGNIGTASYPADAWYHVAIVRLNGTLTVYVNGASIHSVAWLNSEIASAFNVGKDGAGSYIAAGWMDQLRVSKIARYSANFTPPTAAFVADADTVHLFSFDDGHGGQVLKDRSNSGRSVLCRSGLSTAQARFGASSAYCNQSAGGGIFIGEYDNKFHADLAFGSDDFTIDFQIYPISWTSNTGSVFGYSVMGTDLSSFGIRATTTTDQYKLVYSTNGTTQIDSPGFTIATGAWSHVAVTRSGPNLYIFVNGVLQGAAITVGTASLFYGTNPFWRFGEFYNAGYLNGYMDEIRLKRGEAVWTSNFTPPTVPHVADARTVLLLHFEGANGDKVTLDGSGSSYGTNAFGDTITPALSFANGCALSTAQTRGGHSTSLAMAGGSGNALSISFAAPSAGHPLYFGANTKFCIETWMYFASFSTSPQIFNISDAGGTVGNSIQLWAATDGTLRFNGWGSGAMVLSNAAMATGWHHIALVRDGLGWYVYVDGTKSTLLAGPQLNPSYLNAVYRLYIGSYWDGAQAILNGAVDSFRITNGQPRYTANFTPATLVADDMTTLMWEFNGAVGQKWVKELSGNSAMIAANGNARTVKDGVYLMPALSANGGPKSGTARAKFGTGGVEFAYTGAGGAHRYDMRGARWMTWIGGVDSTFTIEAWVYVTTSSTNVIAQKYDSGNGNGVETWQLWINAGGNLPQFRWRDAGGSTRTLTASTAIPLNTWKHVALTYTLLANAGAATAVFYIDGVRDASLSDTMCRNDGDGGFLSLFNDCNGAAPFCGTLDEIRMSNTMRWASSFTPPTLPYGSSYVTGPFYVATLDSSRIDVSDWSTIHSATITQTTPPGTGIKWLVSFDGRATWRKWDGAAWVVVPLNSGASIDTNGNDYLTVQNALKNLNVENYSTIDFAFSLKTANPNFSPSVDAVTLARDEYELGAAKIDYTIKRNGAAGAEIHRITNLKPYPVNVVYDYVA
ncbi:LamG-like jellyroll fold domain-containing protein [Azospirillum melinis]